MHCGAWHESCFILGERHFLGMVAHSPACKSLSGGAIDLLLLLLRADESFDAFRRAGLELTDNERIYEGSVLLVRLQLGHPSTLECGLVHLAVRLLLDSKNLWSSFER